MLAFPSLATEADSWCFLAGTLHEISDPRFVLLQDSRFWLRWQNLTVAVAPKDYVTCSRGDSSNDKSLLSVAYETFSGR